MGYRTGVRDVVTALVRQRPEGDAAALYELASVYDFAGREPDAEPLYRAALAAGLDRRRRPRAVIQLSSTLRNLGRPQESVALLEEEWTHGDHDGLTDVLVAFLALALADAGRARDAVSRALAALAPHLTEYNAVVARYATALRTSVDTSGTSTPDDMPQAASHCEKTT